MRVCPSCGYSNVETAAVCIQCNRALSGVGSASVTPPEPSRQSADTSPSTLSLAQEPPSTLGATPPQPPPAPIPLRASPPPNSEHTKQYFQGLGFGLIPLVVFLVVVGIIKSGLTPSADVTGQLIALIACLLLYLAEFIVMVVFLVGAERRFIGYGLLTAVLITPIAGSIGCIVIISSPL
jgi:hypothetical protein